MRFACRPNTLSAIYDMPARGWACRCEEARDFESRERRRMTSGAENDDKGDGQVQTVSWFRNRSLLDHVQVRGVASQLKHLEYPLGERNGGC